MVQTYQFNQIVYSLKLYSDQLFSHSLFFLFYTERCTRYYSIQKIFLECLLFGLLYSSCLAYTTSEAYKNPALMKLKFNQGGKDKKN